MFLIWVWVFVSFHQNVVEEHPNTIFSNKMNDLELHSFIIFYFSNWSASSIMPLSKLLIRSVITFLALNSKNIFNTLLSVLRNIQLYRLLFLHCKNSHLLNFLHSTLVFFILHCICSQAHYYRPLSSEVTLSGRILFSSLMFSFTFMISQSLLAKQEREQMHSSWPLLWYPLLGKPIKHLWIEDMKNNKLIVFSLSSISFSTFLSSVNGTLTFMFIRK